jgi:hypothetical protein
MSRQKTTASAPIKALRRAALRHPDTHEGVACEGTSLEKRTVKAHRKAFVFLGLCDVMLKLRASLPEARKLARAEPERYKVGANGWVKARFQDGHVPPLARLEAWIDESYQLMVDGPPVKARPRRKRAS